jgi:hypothetical protein
MPSSIPCVHEMIEDRKLFLRSGCPNQTIIYNKRPLINQIRNDRTPYIANGLRKLALPYERPAGSVCCHTPTRVGSSHSTVECAEGSSYLVGPPVGPATGVVAATQFRIVREFRLDIVRVVLRGEAQFIAVGLVDQAPQFGGAGRLQGHSATYFQ